MALPPKSTFQPARKRAPAPSTARPLAESLGGEGVLTNLLARVRASEARLEDLRAMVPPELGARLRAGPLDDEGWTLLAANPTVAAKVRHLLPRIQEHLLARGWGDLPVRLKIQTA